MNISCQRENLKNNYVSYEVTREYRDDLIRFSAFHRYSKWPPAGDLILFFDLIFFFIIHNSALKPGI